MRFTGPFWGLCRLRMDDRNSWWRSAGTMPQLINNQTSKGIVPGKPCSYAMGMFGGLGLLCQLWCMKHLVHASQGRCQHQSHGQPPP